MECSFTIKYIVLMIFLIAEVRKAGLEPGLGSSCVPGLCAQCQLGSCSGDNTPGQLWTERIIRVEIILQHSDTAVVICKPAHKFIE